MVDRLKRSLEQLDTPICPKCSIEMKWLRSTLLNATTVAHVFVCPSCSRIEEAEIARSRRLIPRPRSCPHHTTDTPLKAASGTWRGPGPMCSLKELRCPSSRHIFSALPVFPDPWRNEILIKYFSLELGSFSEWRSWNAYTTRFGGGRPICRACRCHAGKGEPRPGWPY